MAPRSAQHYTDVSFDGTADTLTENPSLLSQMSLYFFTKLDPRRADVILIVCGFVSGLVDGLSFNAWGSFSSMQTGNTVFIALGVSGQPEYPAFLWAKSLIALSVFLLSNVFFIHLGRALNPLRRSTLILSFGLQTAALIVAASVVQAGIVSPKPEDPRGPIQWNQIIPITLLAFQAAGQIVASRLLAFDEIPTVVLTTLLCDLLVDTNLYTRPWSANPKRNRRIAAFLALFMGAMTAGGLSKATGMASSLWLAVALKGSITLSWFFWKDSSGEAREKQVTRNPV
ncbi:hypothetical protein N7448_001551 [Penicillium atrosanguineum]|uniref:DUF1275 domain protein n=1 Tax=Penicillium atrosanguineum TaxID=1132637 RepID=A0A9W9HIY3_9EURO|nr:hypothetical protein N7526_004786 [Penicillium atrosanguineum]KAJ5149973.1 hypothetical protein N7448_001551 [Penicillium atrosanguineum]KAJ5324751.1 hypothetical protein N7476_003351 [Penicillium atrosanguineum]